MSAWIERRRNWLKGYVKPPKRQPIQNPEKTKDAVKEPEEEEEPVYGVTFKRPRCPHCGEKKNLSCVTSRPGVRYYVCRACEKKFKAIEEE